MKFNPPPVGDLWHLCLGSLYNGLHKFVINLLSLEYLLYFYLLYICYSYSHLISPWFYFWVKEGRTLDEVKNNGGISLEKWPYILLMSIVTWHVPLGTQQAMIKDIVLKYSNLWCVISFLHGKRDVFIDYSLTNASSWSIVTCINMYVSYIGWVVCLLITQSPMMNPFAWSTSLCERKYCSYIPRLNTNLVQRVK